MPAAVVDRASRLGAGGEDSFQARGGRGRSLAEPIPQSPNEARLSVEPDRTVGDSLSPAADLLAIDGLEVHIADQPQNAEPLPVPGH